VTAPAPLVRAVVEDTGLGLRAAVLEGGRLVELREEEAGPDERRVTDALFLARVTGVEPRLDGGFLDCGLGERVQGFIAAKDARAAAGVAERRPVRELLREGQRLIVQGLREGVGDKGPRFTADVRLFGLALVHSPLVRRRGEDGGRREGEPTRERARALFPEGGFALRRHAADLPDEALLAEAEALAARWRGLQEAAAGAKRPGRLPAPERPLERLLRGLLERSPSRIEVADPALWAELRALRERSPAFPPRLELERLPEDAGSAFAAAGVDDELDRALAAEVPLAGGGRLLFQETAACVAVDVDGGGRAALDTNLEAAAELGRQVRLRNLGGTIVADFVDLPQRHDQKRLEAAVRRAFRGDPLPAEVHALPALGLIVVSRARRGEPLAARFRRPCPACGGGGEVPSLRAQAERLLAELRGRRLPAAGVRVAPDLDAYLGEAPGTLARLGPVARRRDPALPPGGFAVEG
jgi:ribonuclease G